MFKPRSVKKKELKVSASEQGEREMTTPVPIPLPNAPSPRGKGEDVAMDETSEKTSSSVPQATVKMSEAGGGAVTEERRVVEDELPVGIEVELASKIVFAIETCMSDWGLCHFPSLLKRIKDDDGGYVHISNLLLLAPVVAIAKSQNDIASALSASPSEVLEFDGDKRRLRRKTSPDLTSLESCAAAETWGNRTFYVENVPSSACQNGDACQLRSWLSELLHTVIQIVTLPPLYDSASSRANDRTAASTLYTEELEKSERHKRRPFRLPEGGGPFKGFAFFVVGDDEAAERCRTTWSWQHPPLEVGASTKKGKSTRTTSDEAEEGSGSSDEEESAQSLAERCGVRIMPIEHWNTLRATYLSYQRCLAALQDEPSRDSWQDSSRRSRSKQDERGQGDSRYNDRHRQQRDRYDDRTRRRDDYEDRTWQRDDKRSRANDSERWDHVERETTPEHIVQRKKENAALQRDIEAEGHPEGCVIFCRRIHTSTNRSTLKSVFSAVLAKEGTGAENGKVEYVDYERGLDSVSLYGREHIVLELMSTLVKCHVRLSDNKAALSICRYFADLQVEHDSPRVGDLAAFTPINPMDEESLPVDATLLEGVREVIYWEKIRGTDQGRRSKRRAVDDGVRRAEPSESLEGPTSAEPAVVGLGKHIRFEGSEEESPKYSKMNLDSSSRARSAPESQDEMYNGTTFELEF